MDSERRLAEVELSRRTVDEAIADGLVELGLSSRDHAEIDVKSEGKPGFLGIGRELAVVVMRPKPKPATNKRRRRRGRKGGGGGRDKGDGANTAGRDGEASSKDQDAGKRDGRGARLEKSGAGGRTRGASGSSDKGRQAKDKRSDNRERGSGERRMNSEQTSDGGAADSDEVTIHEQADVAAAFVRGLLEAFGLEGSVETEINEADNILKIDVSGDQTEALVGRKGTIMQSVLELSRTVVQRKTFGAPRMRIDVNGYGARRREALQIYAGRLAEQVLGDGGEVMLEPMNAADRKVVHDAVAEIDGVDSFSEGEDPNRAVVIAPVDTD
jgi:spoIIIJ-associated protein